jgi:uncharacterized alkaline shock family protein YloU
MAMTDPPERLPCGVRLEQLLAQVAGDERPTNEGHQSTCPYCQTALRRLQQGWDDLAELTKQPLSVPGGLTAQIMARIRMLAAQAADFILLGHPRGETRVSHVVIARIVQRVASAVPGVVFASVRAEADEPPQPDRLSVRIQLIVSLGPSLPPLADAVRRTIQHKSPRLTGASIDRIDITIRDIVERPA